MKIKVLGIFLGSNSSLQYYSYASREPDYQVLVANCELNHSWKFQIPVYDPHLKPLESSEPLHASRKINSNPFVELDLCVPLVKGEDRIFFAPKIDFKHSRNENFFNMLNNFANRQGFHLMLEACSHENQTLKAALYLTDIFCAPRKVLVVKAPFCQELVHGFYRALSKRLECCSLADFARLS